MEERRVKRSGVGVVTPLPLTRFDVDVVVVVVLVVFIIVMFRRRVIINFHPAEVQRQTTPSRLPFGGQAGGNLEMLQVGLGQYRRAG